MKLNAADDLEGQILPDGWQVVKKMQRLPGATGGNFSIGYLIEKGEEKAYLKALNILGMANHHGSFLDVLSEVSNAHKFERDLFLLCQDHKLSKINLLLGHGEIELKDYALNKVPYLIFEMADGDARSLLEFGDNIDIAWKLKSLHNVAVGLSQLHGIDVAHQDLKPSNIFVFNKTVSKIGDLGRSLSKKIEAPHKEIDFPGDLDYAPPEIWYGYVVPEWNTRVFAIDLFLLGSLISFYFAGVNMSGLISKNLNPQFHFSSGHDFKDVIPYLIEAYNQALNELSSNIKNKELSNSIRSLVELLCHPVPERRGHPKTLLSNYKPYDLTRIITALDVLYRKVEFKILN